MHTRSLSLRLESSGNRRYKVDARGRVPDSNLTGPHEQGAPDNFTMGPKLS